MNIRRWVTALTTSVVVATGSLVGLSGTPAYAAACTRQTGVSVTDPNTGWNWTTRWVCGNTRGARMYGDATYASPTAYMDSTSSWFVCYRRGVLHSGGNDIWYYSVGDRPFPGMERRGSWGYLPAVNLTTSVDPQPGMAQCPTGDSPPARTDGRKTILLVHGYEINGTADCNAYWGNTKRFDISMGWDLSQVRTVGFYGHDTNCDLYTGVLGSQDTPIEEVGNDLAWLIWSRYSQFGETVDVVAHSLGGLAVRVAITGTQYPDQAPSNGKAWPPYLNVEDVSTLSTPHAGWAHPNLCVGPAHNTECIEMGAGDPFIQQWIQQRPNPQGWWMSGRGGTDWTIIGSRGDDVVNYASALDYRATAKMGHKVLFTSSSVDHGNITEPLGGTFDQYYCDYYNPCNMFPPQGPGGYDLTGWNTNPAGASPVEVALWGVYYAGGR